MSDPLEPELDLDAAMATTMSKYGQMKRRRRGMLGAGGVAAALLVVGGVTVLTNGGNDDVPVEVAGESITAPEETTSTTVVDTPPPVPENYEITVIDGVTMLDIIDTPERGSIVDFGDTAVGGGVVETTNNRVVAVSPGSHPRSAIVEIECSSTEDSVVVELAYEVYEGEFRGVGGLYGNAAPEPCAEPVTMEVPLTVDYSPDWVIGDFVVRADSTPELLDALGELSAGITGSSAVSSSADAPVSVEAE